MKTKNTALKAPFIFLLAQFITVTILNFTNSKVFLDFDSSLALRHAAEMWKDKSLAFPNFAKVSSFEVDCAAFFAAPIYLLTGNIGLSYSISHCVFLTVFCAVIFDIFSNAGVKLRYACLANILILTPYSLGQLDYYNMLFISAGQYEFRAITMFLLIDILLIKDFKKKRSIAVLIAFIMFLGLTTFSVGSYMLVMVLLPLCLYAAVTMYFEKKSVRLDKILILAAALIMSAVILWGRKHFFGVTASRPQYLCTFTEFSDNFINCITSVFGFLGGIVKKSKIKATSFESIAALIKLIFFAVVFVFEAIVIHRHKLIKTEPLVRICCIFSAFHLFVLFVTDTRYGSAVFESRYHILWLLENFICAVYCIYIYFSHLNKDEYDTKLKYFICALTTVMILVSNISGFINIGNYDSQYTDLSQKMLSHAKENDVNAILLYGDDSFGRNSHIIRALDTDMNALWIQDDRDKAYILDYFRGAADSLAIGPSNVLVTPDGKFEDLPSYIRDSYTLVCEDDDLCYYKTDNNKWDLRAGFPEYLDSSEDYLTTPGLKKGYDPDTGMRTVQAKFLSPGDSNIYTYSITAEFNRDRSDKFPAELTLEIGGTVLRDTDEDGKLSLEGIDLSQGQNIELSFKYGIKSDINRIIYTRTPK